LLPWIAAELLFACALAMVHLSRLAEEITWWSNPRFGFVRAADAFSTGSSMMPNKKNPDPAELVRGRAAHVVGSLAGFLALLKGLPLAYQRDLQEDKPPLFEACATLEASLDVMAGMVATLAVDRDAMRRAAEQGYITATAVADALVRRGVPFRAAHHVVGRLVAEAERAGLALTALPDATIAAALAEGRDTTALGLAGDPALPGELRAAATVEAALASCDVVGGTAPGRVDAALTAARARLETAGA
jgi:argininosuccinate lyase